MTDQGRIINIRQQPDGSWTAHPASPLPATSVFVIGGWSEIERLRKDYDAVDHFDTDDYRAFVEQFGPPPE
jgi:hypothetical protein